MLAGQRSVMRLRTSGAQHITRLHKRSHQSLFVIVSAILDSTVLIWRLELLLDPHRFPQPEFLQHLAQLRRQTLSGVSFDGH